MNSFKGASIGSIPFEIFAKALLRAHTVVCPVHSEPTTRLCHTSCRRVSNVAHTLYATSLWNQHELPQNVRLHVRDKHEHALLYIVKSSHEGVRHDRNTTVRQKFTGPLTRVRRCMREAPFSLRWKEVSFT